MGLTEILLISAIAIFVIIIMLMNIKHTNKFNSLETEVSMKAIGSDCVETGLAGKSIFVTWLDLETIIDSWLKDEISDIADCDTKRTFRYWDLVLDKIDKAGEEKIKSLYDEIDQYAIKVARYIPDNPPNITTITIRDTVAIKLISHIIRDALDFDIKHSVATCNGLYLFEKNPSENEYNIIKKLKKEG